MSGIFSSAWSSNYTTITRVVSGTTVAQGYADYGDLSGVTDSTPQIAGETDNYVVAVGGTLFVDNPAGATPALTPFYACVRRSVKPEYGDGAKAYLYINGFTPSPSTWYPMGTSVPGALTIRPRSWLTLPNDYIAVADGTYIYLGNPFVQTKRATITSGGLLSGVVVYALGFTEGGQIVAAAKATRVSDSADVVCVSAPFSIDSGFPASVDMAVNVYTHTNTNPWKACMGAIGATYGNEVLKTQSQVFSGKLSAWAPYVLIPTITTEGQLYGMSDAAFLRFSDVGSAPVKAINSGTLNYAVSAGAFTFSGSATDPFSSPAANLIAFDGTVTAKSVYADSDQWTPPPVPPFWRSFRYTRETV